MATSTYTPLYTTTISGSAAANITISSISQAYTDLVLIVDGTTTSLEDITIQYNGDTATNYSVTYVNGSGSAAGSGRQSNQAQITLGYLGTVQGGTSFHFMNYSNTTTYKTALARGSVANWSVAAKVGLWRSTTAITSIKIAHPYSFAVGTTFSLYGVAAAGAGRAAGGPCSVLGAAAAALACAAAAVATCARAGRAAVAA